MVKRIDLVVLYSLMASWPAMAADQNPPARPPLKAAAAAPAVCTVASCSGFYIGGHVEGVGSNADILGSGINGSIFANGAGLGLHAGYQLWNGNFFAAGEIGGTWYTGGTSIITDVANVDPRWSVDYLAKFGYGLQGLFNSAPAPSQGPVNVIQQLNAALISPYFLVGGRTRNFGSGLATGGGVQYAIGGGWNAFAEYLHVNYEQTVTSGVAPVSIGTENIVRAGINLMF
jgi:hypothetical protein